MNTNSRPYLIITNQGQTLPPFELTKSKYILGRDPQIADLLVPDDWGIVSRCQATLIEHQGTYIIYDGDRRQPSSNKLFINHHLISHDRGYALQNGDVINIGQNTNILITLQFHNSQSLPTAKTSSLDTIFLREKSIVLGRDPDVTLQLA